MKSSRQSVSIATLEKATLSIEKAVQNSIQGLQSTLKSSIDAHLDSSMTRTPATPVDATHAPNLMIVTCIF